MFSSLSTLFAAAIFAGIVLAGAFLAWSIRTRAEAAREELSRRLGASPAELALREAQQGGATAAALGDFGRNLAGFLARSGSDQSVERLLAEIGALAVAGLGLSLWGLSGPARLSGLALGLLPVLRLVRAARLRQEALVRQLPDALDLICRSLRAGHAFSDALRSAVLELEPPIAVEFALLFEEHRLGLELREGLAHLLARNPENFDLRLFASAVLLQRETGGNLIEILEHLSDTIRERLVFQSKVEALTAEVRLSAGILTALPFVVGFLILALRPEYLKPMFITTTGHWLLGIAGGSLVVGVSLMRRLARVAF